MRKYTNGRYIVVDLKSIKPSAQCDITGLFGMKKDMRKWMTIAGDKEVWTGKYVHKLYYAPPNPQMKPPKVHKDPRPVPDARPQQVPLLGQPIVPYDESKVPENERMK